MSSGSDILGTIKGTTVDSHYGIFKSGRHDSMLHFSCVFPWGPAVLLWMHAIFKHVLWRGFASRMRLVKPRSNDEIDPFVVL